MKFGDVYVASSGYEIMHPATESFGEHILVEIVLALMSAST